MDNRISSLIGGRVYRDMYGTSHPICVYRSHHHPPLGEGTLGDMTDHTHMYHRPIWQNTVDSNV